MSAITSPDSPEKLRVPEYRLTRRVQFYETDMAGIVHFSNYFRMMEEVEHHFFGATNRKRVRHVTDFDAIASWLGARDSWLGVHGATCAR